VLATPWWCKIIKRNELRWGHLTSQINATQAKEETGVRFVRCAVCLFLCQESQLELLSATQGLVTKVVSLWNHLIDEQSFCWLVSDLLCVYQNWNSNKIAFICTRRDLGCKLLHGFKQPFFILPSNYAQEGEKHLNFIRHMPLYMTIHIL